LGSVEEKGYVVEVRDGYALVRAEENPQCAGCASSGFCQGTGGERIVEAINDIGAVTGECVVMAVPSRALLKASFQVYIVPIVGLLAGAAGAQLLVGRYVGPEQAGMAAGIGGLAGMVATILALRVFLGNRSSATALRPRIIRRG
jgi:sigma-E factor negative regulatory protein RseC